MGPGASKRVKEAKRIEAGLRNALTPDHKRSKKRLTHIPARERLVVRPEFVKKGRRK
jgi:hypothetical protein